MWQQDNNTYQGCPPVVHVAECTHRAERTKTIKAPVHFKFKFNVLNFKLLISRHYSDEPNDERNNISTIAGEELLLINHVSGHRIAYIAVS